MESFKQLVRVHSIGSSLFSGRPLSATWGMPEFARTLPGILEGIFGEEAHEVYTSLAENEKEAAVKWFETSGREINDMFCGEEWETWDDSAAPKFDLQRLKEAHPEVYEGVVRMVVRKAYANSCPAAMLPLIEEKFMADPQMFTQEIRRNVG